MSNKCFRTLWKIRISKDPTISAIGLTHILRNRHSDDFGCSSQIGVPQVAAISITTVLRILSRTTAQTVCTEDA